MTPSASKLRVFIGRAGKQAQTIGQGFREYLRDVVDACMAVCRKGFGRSRMQRMEEVNDDDLLLPFERHALRDPYREYIRTKRNNRFATMQALPRIPRIWAGIELLDSIWLRELLDLYSVIDADVPLPLSLFMGAFLRTRVSFELGLSGCIGESADLMRGAIEYGVHGMRILQNPELAEVWLYKDKGKDEYKAYRESFEREKKDRLFKGQDALHHYWTQFSEWGSHSTKSALALRMRFDEAEGIKATFQFFETDHARLADFLLTLLDTVHRLELILFDCFRTRLMLDVGLGEMRSRFGRLKRQAQAPRRPH